MNGKIVIPVFYQVDPSDVRQQRRSSGEAFVHHENNFPDKVQKWRDALTEGSNLSGYDSTESRNEAELVEKIIADISKKLEDVSDSADLDDFEFGAWAVLLLEEVVHSADGNPLALEVLGSSLYQKSKQQWKVKLQNLKLISVPNIYNVLKISYDELHLEEKKTFLDIACFFKGEDIDFVRRIQDDPTSQDALVDKSLITIFYNELQMHDLWQEMENLIELSLPYSKVEQIWEEKKKAFVLKSVDLRHSQYLLRMPDLSEAPNLERTNILNCTGYSYISSSIQNFNHLSRLCFRGCKSLRSFPSNLHFVSPIAMDFSSCVNFTEFPQISGNITDLDLHETAIEEVSSSIECLTNLQVFSLDSCSRLKRVSTRIFECCILLPWSKIAEWSSNQSSGSEITLQLPQHFRQNLMGFALGAVLGSKSSHYLFDVHCQYTFEISTLSERKHVRRSCVWDSFQITDHVMLGFSPCGNVRFPDDNHHTTVSFEFLSKSNVVLCCGLCPVYANPDKTKPNNLTLNFATQIWKLDDKTSTSGTSDEVEFEASSHQEESEPGP
ncbi:Disease resistance-like protein DSC1 [Citrus sinensis]|uniref:Disease resistance-like protein DSC1 n=1 Tax=Citrus sinensis TaxID=2711 RepID=A0ACB8MBM7_CITSI|nr:Disease resistance-like protein DSC1 [Citrus sinensis]